MIIDEAVFLEEAPVTTIAVRVIRSYTAAFDTTMPFSANHSTMS